MKKVISTPNAPEAIGPYSQAIIKNGILYTSGQIAIDPNTNNLVLDDIRTETKQVMKNLSAVLNASNMTFTDVLKCTIFLKDMNQYQEINEVYASFFDDNPPAREAVQVVRLPKDVNVEISLIASK
jgi:2-iminobutanoate/2-iminopropanoate deaminase